MPYVACPACGLQTYTAAAWGGADECPGCSGELPSRAREIVAARNRAMQIRMAQVDSARAALQQLRQRAKLR
jgi:hypothetical protein